jgi:hypothetical protein
MYQYPMSPQMSLSVALAIEENQIRCHREWALRLRPFNLGLSQLLMIQAEEMESCRKELLFVANRLLDGRDRLPPVHTPYVRIGFDHFFVLRWDQARLLLDKASRFKEEALNFYCARLVGASDGPLSQQARFYQMMAGLKKAQGQRLQQSLAQLPTPRPNLPDAAWHDSFAKLRYH